MSTHLKILALVACVMALAGAAVAATGDRAGHHWKPAERAAFIDGIAAQAWDYEHPRAYARCLLDAAQHSFRSYNAFLTAADGPTDRFTHTKRVRRCIVAYGGTIWDAVG